MIDFDFAALRPIGLTQAIASQLAQLDPTSASTRLVRVTEIARDWTTVHDGAAVLPARAQHRLIQSLHAEGVSLAVGDWVLLDTDSNGEHWLSQRLAPLTHVARRAAGGRRQSLASNVETALLVMGLDKDFNLRRMERYIALVEAAGVAPVAVLSKADVSAHGEERLAQLRARLPARVAALAVDARDPQTALALAPWLGAGQTLILLGTSGAGKSTLTNTLSGGAQATGGVREGDGRGRHTTTARSLHQCEGGACIIDTPGLRTWTPDADEEALAGSFDDIATLAAQCQFRDCQHQSEPGCAVLGAVDADRIANYRKLVREVRRAGETPLDRIAARAKWKVLVKEAQTRGRSKRGG